MSFNINPSIVLWARFESGLRFSEIPKHYTVRLCWIADNVSDPIASVFHVQLSCEVWIRMLAYELRDWDKKNS